MSQQEEKKGTLRKVIAFGAIGLLLFGLPLMSYVYLSKGFKWRMDAQSELKDFGKMPKQPMVWNDGSHEDMISGKLCVVYNFGQHADLTDVNKAILDTGEELIKQFGYNRESVRNDFRFVMVRGTESYEFKGYREGKPTAHLSNWMPSGSVNTFGKIMTEGFQYYCQSEGVTPYKHYFAMTDTSGIIRRFYNAEDKGEVDRMVQQIAIIIPKQFKK
jgi:hypothetical protein